MPQEPLRPAARNLAIAMLAGEVRQPGIGTHYWIGPASGGLLLAAAIVLLLVVRPVPAYTLLWVLYGAVVLVAGLLWPPLLRRRLHQALDRNQHDPAA